MPSAKQALVAATAFVKSKDLLTLPPNANLEVIETPVFMRGIYGVGGFNPAPALEPKLGAFFWVTPIPADWPQSRVDSKLREYNDSGMQHLTVHEAMHARIAVLAQFRIDARLRPIGPDPRH